MSRLSNARFAADAPPVSADDMAGVHSVPASVAFANDPFVPMRSESNYKISIPSNFIPDDAPASTGNFIPDSPASQAAQGGFIPDSHPPSPGGLQAPPIDPETSTIPDYINRVGHGITKGIGSVVSALTSNASGETGGDSQAGILPWVRGANVSDLGKGVAASLYAAPASQLPWVAGVTLDAPKTLYDIATKGLRGAVQSRMEQSRLITSPVTPTNPSDAFQAGMGVLGLPFTAATELTGGIKDPELKAATDAAIGIGLFLVGGKKGGELVKRVEGDHIPHMDNIPPKPPGEGPNGPIEGTATRIPDELPALPDKTPLTTTPTPDLPVHWNPEKAMQRDAEARAPNQTDLFSYVNEIQKADPEVIKSVSKLVERDSINGDTINPMIPYEETPTSQAQRANQVASLAETNRLVEEITLKAIPESAPVDLPPVEAGMKRLYRGGKVFDPSRDPSLTNDRAGRWFSETAGDTSVYGQLNYIDVPEAVAAQHQSGAGVYILPKELAGKAISAKDTLRSDMEAAVGTPSDKAPSGKSWGQVSEEFKRSQGGVGGKQGGAIDFFGRETDTKKSKINWDDFNPGHPTPKQAMMINGPSISGADLVAAIIKNFPKETKDFEGWVFGDINRDIKQQELGGLTTSSFRSYNRYISDMARLPEFLFHSMDRVIQRLYWEENAINAQYHDAVIANNKHYGLTNTRIAKIDLIKKDIGIVLKMEAKPETWFNGRDYIPTTEQMVQAGMSPKSAAIWRGNHENQVKMWSVLEKYVAYLGIEMPRRIPGQVPHAWRGPYQVIGKIGGDVAARYNYYNVSDMRAGLKAAQDKTSSRGDLAWETRVQPTIDARGPQAIKDLLERRASVANEAGIKALLGAVMEEIGPKGVIATALDRADIPVTGHTLARLNESGPFGLNRRQIVDAAQLLQKTQETVSKAYSQAKYLSEYIAPLDAAGLFPERSSLHAAVMHITNAFFGHPEKLLRDLDSDVREWFQEKGLNPLLGKAILKTIHSGFSLYYLFLKPPYYIANYFQKLLGLPVLMLMQAQGTLRGEATGSITKAILKASTGRLSADNRMATHYAREHGVLAPNFTDAINPGFRDAISAMIETNTRRGTFLQGFNYFDQFMPRDQALLAAGHVANMASISYAGRVGQPIAIGRIPDALKPFYLFLSYPLHMLSLTSSGIRTLVTSAKEHNAKATLQAAGHIAALQGIGLAVFGLGGVVAMQSWDALTKAVSGLFGIYLPDTKDLAQRLGTWADNEVKGPAGALLSQVSQVGLVSTQIRYDISASGAGAALKFGAAGKEALESILDLGLLALRQGASMAGVFDQKPVAKNDWLQEVRKMPPQLREGIEYIMKVPTLSDLADLIKGKTQDYSIGRDAGGRLNINEPGMPRSQMDTIAALMGLHSVQEKASETTNFIIENQKKAAQVDIEHSMVLIKEPGFPLEQKNKLMLDLTQNYYQDLGPMIAALIKSEKNQSLTDEQRQDLQAATGSKEAKLWWNKRRDLKDEDKSSVTPLQLLGK